ncbi:formate dehydrogenase accessory protein FdhE [Desulfohalovibrio reitneri]|uniref:formate dehydrogenase accessory protein FdhE n=1 Tax=Desulfohalovibrio reitneri TaxID=1307759 RepID=UPI0006892170|nr:formate dehydrogenase accessory protein FdhE [Desulfohalovibrio reitneri]
MTETPVISGPETVSQTIERYASQRPQMEPILRAFESPLRERAKLREEFARDSLDLSGIDCSRLVGGDTGAPLLAGVDLAFLARWIERSASALLPLLQRAMPDSQELDRIAEAASGKGLDLKACGRMLLDGDRASLEREAEVFGVSPAMLEFTLAEILAAPLASLTDQLQEKLHEASWRQGVCPVCGSFPSVACLGRPETVELDSLVGGGGQKYLHCSLCGHDWRYRRDACPACENADPGTREMHHAVKARQERIEACTKCGAYFLCIDLREYAEDPDLSVAPLALMHLDIIASGKGYRPLAPAPWNTFPAREAEGA